MLPGFEPVAIGQAVVVRPGDVVLVEFAGNPSAGQLAKARDRLMAYMPGVKFVLTQAHVGAVYRPDDQQEAEDDAVVDGAAATR